MKAQWYFETSLTSRLTGKGYILGDFNPQNQDCEKLKPSMANVFT
jgi:hypothetical protein